MAPLTTTTHVQGRGGSPYLLHHCTYSIEAIGTNTRYLNLKHFGVCDKVLATTLAKPRVQLAPIRYSIFDFKGYERGILREKKSKT